jgi:hypothetical protein
MDDVKMSAMVDEILGILACSCLSNKDYVEVEGLLLEILGK